MDVITNTKKVQNYFNENVLLPGLDLDVKSLCVPPGRRGRIGHAINGLQNRLRARLHGDDLTVIIRVDNGGENDRRVRRLGWAVTTTKSQRGTSEANTNAHT